MNLDNLRDIFHGQLKDIYSAEKQLVDAMPSMAEAIKSPELKKTMQSHFEQTKSQYERIRDLCDRLDVNPGNTKCDAMEGLIKEGKHMAKMEGDKDARDAGIICAAQKIEHYEIATYGSLRTWAKMLGEDDAYNVLNKILDEEYNADNKLDKLAEGYLNEKAMD